MKKYIVDIKISCPGGRIDLGQLKVISRIECRVFECFFKWQIYIFCYIQYFMKDYEIIKITEV